jgi:hypothetical protein
MKRLLLTAILGLCCFLLKAQSFTVTNSSLCTINFYVAAADPTCGSSAATITYSIPPSGTITFASFAAATWTSPFVPPPGWQWSFIKEWNSCGPMSWTPPACGQNVCAVGIPCTGLPLTACMIITTTCNTCGAIKTQWIPLGGGNVGVKIW